MINEHDVEEYIDKHGMVHLLVMLENICLKKAEHARDNWQDHALANAWRRGATRIRLAMRFKDLPL